MSTRPDAVVVDALDPAELARFWSAALDWPVTYADDDEVVVEFSDEGGCWGDIGTVALVFGETTEPKQGKNRVHLDLASTSLTDQAATVEKLLDLGGSRVDLGQGDVPWQVLADPEGNELCVLEPREMYAGGPRVAAVVLDCADPAALAGFWQAATGWPVAHAEDGLVSLRHPGLPATALELVRSPDAKTVKDRLHVDVAPFRGDDQAAEVERLVAAGARPVDIGQRDVSWVVLADPDGHELCVLTPR